MDVVYDSVGKTTFDKSLNSLRPRGMLALPGRSGGVRPSIHNPERQRLAYLTRPSLGFYLLTRDELLWRRQRAAVFQGKLVRASIASTRPGAELDRAPPSLLAFSDRAKLLTLAVCCSYAS